MKMIKLLQACALSDLAQAKSKCKRQNLFYLAQTVQFLKILRLPKQTVKTTLIRLWHVKVKAILQKLSCCK
jgi:hypothetical protein